MRAAIHPRQSLKTHNRLTRVICYVLGMLILAIGLTLTAETRLGASALTAIPFVVSLRFPISFANATLGLFLIYVAVQFVVTRDRRTLVLTLLQLPLSVLFTGVMHIAQDAIEVEAFPLPARLGFLALAIVFTGIGAAMTLKMKLIPNPGDGFVQTLAEKTGKPLGTMKNIVDSVSVCTAALLSLLCMGKLEGVGIGSVMAMLGVGRVIALYNNLTKNIQLEPQPQETEESEERQHKAKYSRADI